MRIEMASHHFRRVKRRAAVTPQMQLLELLEELGVLRDDELNTSGSISATQARLG
jgi:hypothetical protein